MARLLVSVRRVNDSKRIAFPSLNGTTITGHFGRLKHFVVVEVAEGREVSRSQRDRLEEPPSEGGVEAKPHHKTLLELIADCEVVVAGGMGLPMVDNLAASGINLILTSERDIDQALELYLTGDLLHDPSKAHEHGQH